MNRPWFPMYVCDYLADTPDLSIEEHGAYLLLLMLTWRRPDCALPNDEKWLRGALPRMHGHTFNRLVKPLLERFFTLEEDGRWHNKRLTKERQNSDKTSANAKQSADKRWAKSNEINNLADAPAMQITITDTVREEREDTHSDKESECGAPHFEFDNTASYEDQFWQLTGELEKKGVARSRSAQLLKLSDGNFVVALAQLRSVARAKEPSSYLGAVINGLRRDRGEFPPPTRGRPKQSHEPEFATSAREDGYQVEQLESGNWRIGSNIYDQRGELIGW